MTEKAFTLGNPEGQATWTPTVAQWETTPEATLVILEQLELGGRYVDEDGYVWTRVS